MKDVSLSVSFLGWRFFKIQHKFLSNTFYIIHQKIEKDNDKVFYFQHNLSDSGSFQQKKRSHVWGKSMSLVFCPSCPSGPSRPSRRIGQFSSALISYTPFSRRNSEFRMTFPLSVIFFALSSGRITLTSVLHGAEICQVQLFPLNFQQLSAFP